MRFPAGSLDRIGVRRSRDVVERLTKFGETSNERSGLLRYRAMGIPVERVSTDGRG